MDIISFTHTDFIPKILISVLNNDKYSITFGTNNSILKTLRQNKDMPLKRKQL